MGGDNPAPAGPTALPEVVLNELRMQAHTLCPTDEWTRSQQREQAEVVVRRWGEVWVASVLRRELVLRNPDDVELPYLDPAECLNLIRAEAAEEQFMK
ncbi:hypothetical protein OG225_41585 (plasmid) [Nocardia sp. NBC_01377]|uniref:hypothetical protein n=1 Tax=Nocardia sp. NBC_01377 TaxID=2903595 RepID=UPI002F907EB9